MSAGHGRVDLSRRARALEELLYEKGYLTPQAVSAVVAEYEDRVSPLNGARVVARAWTDAGFRARLLADGTSAVAELGYAGAEGYEIRVVENTETVHNVIVCTLCSCYPWPLLGLPPHWYKSAAYRSRVVVSPRSVLAEFGLDLPSDTTVRVWDSTSELRYFVLPRRPAGTDGWTEDQLVGVVTRDTMIGTAAVVVPGRGA